MPAVRSRKRLDVAATPIARNYDPIAQNESMQELRLIDLRRNEPSPAHTAAGPPTPAKIHIFFAISSLSIEEL
jgi:hypothetical protein